MAFTASAASTWPTPPTELERSMQDVIFIGVTLAFFAVVTLLVKGLERL